MIIVLPDVRDSVAKRQFRMRRYARALLCIGFVSALLGCVATRPATPVVSTAPAVASPPAPSVTGTASWYQSSKQLQRTASGQMLNNNALTAASSVIPIGTKVRVKRLNGSQSVVVVVNDRMPPNHRLIDVTPTAANKLGLKKPGVAKVTVTPVAAASAP
jgi:rare lipoprotein A